MTWHWPPDWNKARIEFSLAEGAAYYLVNSEWRSQDFHYFVLLNQEYQTDQTLLFASCTSQIANRQEAAMLMNHPPETLVYADPIRFSVLTKECVFDCNSLTDFSREQLTQLLTADKLKFKSAAPPELLADLRRGVNASRLIPAQWKSLV